MSRMIQIKDQLKLINNLFTKLHFQLGQLTITRQHEQAQDVNKIKIVKT